MIYFPTRSSNGLFYYREYSNQCHAGCGGQIAFSVTRDLMPYQEACYVNQRFQVLRDWRRWGTCKRCGETGPCVEVDP